MTKKNATLKIKVENGDGEVEEQSAPAKETGAVLSEIAKDLQHTFANVYNSVFLLYERGNLLDDLEKKSEKLAEQGERLNHHQLQQSRCFSVWNTLKMWVVDGCRWVWGTAFCRALRNDPSMNRPLKLIQ